MSSAGASRENRVEEIVRRYKRQRLKFFAVIYLLPGLGLVSILLFDWVLRLGAEWMAFRFWAVEGPIILWCLLIAMIGIKRPRFLRAWIFGPEPRLSDEEKAENASREEIQRQFEQLTRPLSWLTNLAYFGCIFTLVFWWIGDITMTIELGIATTLLGIIALLGVWAHRRIHQAHVR